MATTLALGDWADATVLEDGVLPPKLADAAFMWRGDPRRFPVLVRLRRSQGTVLPYIAVLPQDSPPFDAAHADETELDGILLAEPMEHGCFACGERFAVLYADFGLPTPGEWRGRHPTVAGCLRAGRTRLPRG